MTYIRYGLGDADPGGLGGLSTAQLAALSKSKAAPRVVAPVAKAPAPTIMLSQPRPTLNVAPSSKGVKAPVTAADAAYKAAVLAANNAPAQAPKALTGSALLTAINKQGYIPPVPPPPGVYLISVLKQLNKQQPPPQGMEWGVVNGAYAIKKKGGGILGAIGSAVKGIFKVGSAAAGVVAPFVPGGGVIKTIADVATGGNALLQAGASRPTGSGGPVAYGADGTEVYEGDPPPPPTIQDAPQQQKMLMYAGLGLGAYLLLKRK